MEHLPSRCWVLLALVAAAGACASTHPVSRGRPARAAAGTSRALESVAALREPVVLEVEGEFLAPVEAAAFSADRDALWVRRADGSREVWRLDEGDLARRYSAEDWNRERAVDGPLQIEPSVPAGGSATGGVLVLATAAGAGEQPLLAWARGLGCTAEVYGAEVRLTAASDVRLTASADGRIVAAEKDGNLHVMHRQARSHFTVSGWTRGFSSHYGYAGNSTTWAGSVSAVFGPAQDQLVLQSVAPRSINYVYAASRLYDPRTGKVIGPLPEETCQPNEVSFSPLGKYIVRKDCARSSLLVSDGSSGKSLPALPAEALLSFRSDETLLAAQFSGAARVFAPGDPAPRYVVPGPTPSVLDVELAGDQRALAILRDDGLDLWDLRRGTLVHHVASTSQGIVSRPMQRSGSGRFLAFGEEGGAGPRTVVVDTESGSAWRDDATVAVDPTRDVLARAEADRLTWIDLATKAPVAGSASSLPHAEVITIVFSATGTLVVELRGCKLWAFDGTGRVRFKTPSLDRGGCQPVELAPDDRARVDGESGSINVSLQSGARSPAGSGPTELEAWFARPRPSFTPSVFEEAIRTDKLTRLRWRARGGLFVGGTSVPVLTREKDGKSVTLHAFPYGRGRAAVVIDERGRWDANELGANLVRARRGGKDDDTERKARRVPGLLAAFCRGE